MHRIIKSNLKTFCEEHLISTAIEETKQFECFVNYCIVRDAYGDDFDAWDITSEEDDAGIDGIAFLIDKELVTSLDEAKTIFQRRKKNIDVDIFLYKQKRQKNMIEETYLNLEME